jgi:hypothetical protein
VDDGAIAPTSDTLPAARPKCSRCESLAHSRIRGDNLCKECVVQAIYKRCRQPAAAPPLQAEDVLIAWSGGGGSRMLVELGSLTMHVGRRKRWWRDAATVHVDTSALRSLWRLPGSTATRNDGESQSEGDGTSALAARAMASVVATSVAAGLTCYVVPLETAFADKLHVCPVAAPAIAASSAPSGAPSPLSIVAAEVASDAGRAAVAQLRAWRAGSSDSDTSSAAGPLHDAAARLNAVFQDAAGLDAKSDLLETLTRRLVAETAAALGFRHVALGSTIDRLSQVVVNMTCTGGGYALPLEVSAVDTRWESGFSTQREAVQPVTAAVSVAATAAAALDADGHSTASTTTATSDTAAEASSNLLQLEPLRRVPTNWYPAQVQEPKASAAGPPLPYGPCPPGGVRLVRPFLEVETKEIAVYARYKKLSLLQVDLNSNGAASDAENPSSASASVFLPTFTTAAPVRSAISRTTLNVLAGLQASYPSTVHNVTRTARKLASVEVKQPQCRLCAAPMMVPANGDGGRSSGGSSGGSGSSGEASASASDKPPALQCCYPCSMLLESIGNGGGSSADSSSSSREILARYLRLHAPDAR